MLHTKQSGYMFELWDLASRNIVGEFDAAHEVLALVCALTTERAQRATENFALVREDERGRSITIAQGTGLFDLACRSPQPSATGAS